MDMITKSHIIPNGIKDLDRKHFSTTIIPNGFRSAGMQEK